MSGEESEAGPRSSGWIRWLALGLVVASVGYFVATRGFPGAPGQPAGPPSIVLVLIDTLRADYLGAYGFEGDISPALDRLAEESIVFENAISQAPWTKPAVASLFTSLYPEQHGVIAHDGRYGGREGDGTRASMLPQRATTLAEELRRAGYETAAFVANPWIQRQQGFAQGFDVFDAKDAGNRVPANVLLQKATDWLAQRDSEKPFFLYIHLMDVHGPYDAPRGDYEAVLGSPGLGEVRPLTEEEAARRKRYLLRGGGTHGDDLSLESWRASYAAGVRSVDRQLGGFVENLERSGDLDDALLIVTSDHGEELADHGGWDHGDTLFDEQIHVPLLVRLPGRSPPGRRVDRVVSLVDLMPTLLGLAGTSAPDAVAGEDLRPLLAGGNLDGEGVAFSSGAKWRPGLKAVRTKDRKLLHAGEADRLLVFDVKADPQEKTGLAASDEDRATLGALLEAHRQTLEAGTALEAQATTMDRDTRDKLRALGYLE